MCGRSRRRWNGGIACNRGASARNIDMTADKEVAALSLRWQRAALLGSLWAANEIVLGSFLHNLQIPFAGTILAAIAVALLVAGSRLWRDAGVLWRAGVVCSLMKSISPSAVILGPMIGIMLEAFIIAAAAALFRYTAAGCIAGGMIATVAPILQKILAILLTYGMDAARICASLLSFLANALDVGNADPAHILFWFVAVQALPGAAAAVAGIALARGLNGTGSGDVAWTEGTGAAPDLLHSTTQRFSTALLVAHVVLMVTGLVVLPLLPPILSPAPAALYLAAVLYRYPALRPKFRRVRLWLELAAVAILAGILLGVVAPEGTGTWWTGLLSGVVMTARAIIVIGAFGAIGIELRDPVIMAWFFKRGLGTLSAAMRVAFQALPSMLQGLTQEAAGLRHPLRSTRRMLGFVLHRLEVMNGSARGADVFIVTGAQGTGKTRLLVSVVDLYRKRGGSVRGVLSHVVYEADVRKGYDIEILQSKERIPLCRMHGIPPGESVGRFTFIREGVAAGLRALSSRADSEHAVCFVDEVGPLEMRGMGWAPALPALLRNPAATVVLTVRPDLIGPVQEKFEFTARKIWEARGREADEHEIVETIVITARPRSQNT
jgi:nucleoside-triphosphatase THEP1